MVGHPSVEGTVALRQATAVGTMIGVRRRFRNSGFGPEVLPIVSSHPGHMPLHLFELEETLEVQGEYVLWPR